MNFVLRKFDRIDRIHRSIHDTRPGQKEVDLDLAARKQLDECVNPPECRRVARFNNRTHVLSLLEGVSAHVNEKLQGQKAILHEAVASAPASKPTRGLLQSVLIQQMQNEPQGPNLASTLQGINQRLSTHLKRMPKRRASEDINFAQSRYRSSPEKKHISSSEIHHEIHCNDMLHLGQQHQVQTDKTVDVIKPKPAPTTLQVERKHKMPVNSRGGAIQYPASVQEKHAYEALPHMSYKAQRPRAGELGIQKPRKTMNVTKNYLIPQAPKHPCPKDGRGPKRNLRVRKSATEKLSPDCPEFYNLEVRLFQNGRRKGNEFKFRVVITDLTAQENITFSSLTVDDDNYILFHPHGDLASRTVFRTFSEFHWITKPSQLYKRGVRIEVEIVFPISQRCFDSMVYFGIP